MEFEGYDLPNCIQVEFEIVMSDNVTQSCRVLPIYIRFIAEYFGGNVFYSFANYLQISGDRINSLII